MELLTIRHEDFELTVECAKFGGIWDKARRNVGEEALFTAYSWSGGVREVVRHAPNGDRTVENGMREPAVFFDNADYPVWVDFRDYVRNARFGSALESENERFAFRKHVLAGVLNYGNDIGRGELSLVYDVGGEERRFTFSFEVLSSKLDYHKHWKGIVEDIEREYRMLSLAYMRRTFHGFGADPGGDTPEIVWWSVFAAEQEKFICACKGIVDRPRHRLRAHTVYKRADRLTHVPAGMENKLAEHRRDPTHLYKTREQTQTNDTQENRFLKFALAQIAAKYDGLKRRIDSLPGLSESKRDEMRETGEKLRRLQRHPFFRTVGRYKGMRQESMVLQQATGYSQVYRTWNLLRRGYTLNDGMYRLQTKDIATLYEIWCFIEVSHIVRERLRLTDEDVDHRNRMELNGMFVQELGKGGHSHILFRKDGVELAELVYNPTDTDEANNDTGMGDVVAPTVPQKPDIVLRLTKDDMRERMKMTYLFDAKYRIDGRKGGVDTPPGDAINQMHRYRDAIYYKDYSANELKKEVIGGYILFPGDGKPTDVAVSKFYKTIEEVNIGAFPLRPKDEDNRRLLKDFISRLIEKKGSETVSETIPQKGAFVEVGDRVLIGLVRGNRPGYERGFRERTATLYYTGRQFPTTIALHNLHYFIPYMKGLGIRDVYEITKIRTITSREAKGTDKGAEQGDDLRLAFELRFSHGLYPDYRMIRNNLSDRTFKDTTFGEQSEW